MTLARYPDFLYANPSCISGPVLFYSEMTGQTGIFKASYKREEKGAVANETRNYWNS
jgi:hypothetical protein